MADLMTKSAENAMENTHLSSHNDENMYGNSSDDVLCDKDEHHFKDDTTSSIQYQSSPSNHSTSSSPFFSFPFLKRRQSYTINPPDDTYNVTYLGNVLTVMAKGEGCVEKPLNLIWKTYCERKKTNIHMKLSVTRSGLKAETKQQGLTEYWAHRITFCLAPPDYPRLFCWVYKHEGKRMKPELRCHAVLCKKTSEPNAITLKLHEFLQAALQEYRREKLSMQNARLNATVIGKAGTCPKRKLLLQTGTMNFCPPVSRSKSTPRLVSIDEEEEAPQTHQEDDLFDLDSLCYHESPSVDDECASVSATSSSSSSSPFFRQTSLIDHGISESDQHSEISDCTTRLSSSLSLEKGMSVCSNDDVDNEVNEQASGALNGSLGTGIGWNPFRRASAMASIGLRRQHSINAKEPDTVSDESGYQDGTISHSDDEGILAEQDEGDFAEDEYDIQAKH